MSDSIKKYEELVAEGRISNTSFTPSRVYEIPQELVELMVQYSRDCPLLSPRVVYTMAVDEMKVRKTCD